MLRVRTALAALTVAAVLTGCDSAPATTTPTNTPTTTQSASAATTDTRLTYTGPTSLLVKDLLLLTATSDSDAPIRFSASPSDVCVIVMGTNRISGIAEGTCNLTVQQDATTNHAAALLEIPLQVNAPTGTQVAAAPTLALTFVADTGINLTGITSQGILRGEDASPVTATPENDCAQFNGWRVNGKLVQQPTLLIKNVQADATYRAAGARLMFAIEYQAGDGGTIARNETPTQRTKLIPTVIRCKEPLGIVTAFPDEGFRFLKWTDGETSNPHSGIAERSGSYRALFERLRFTITYSAGAGGAVTGTRTQSVQYGADGANVTAVADAGYVFVKWSDGLTTSSRTERSVMADVTVAAVFAQEAVRETGGSGYSCPPGSVPRTSGGRTYCALA